MDKPPKRQHAHKVVDYFLLQLALFFPSVAGDNWFNWIHLGVLLDETVKVVCSVFALTLDVLLVVLADTQPPDISHQYAKRFGEGLFSTHQTGNLQICQIGILPFFSQPSYGRHWKIQGSTVPSIVSTGEIFLVLLMKAGDPNIVPTKTFERASRSKVQHISKHHLLENASLLTKRISYLLSRKLYLKAKD